jgi:hypothetical protein
MRRNEACCLPRGKVRKPATRLPHVCRTVHPPRASIESRRPTSPTRRKPERWLHACPPGERERCPAKPIDTARISLPRTLSRATVWARQPAVERDDPALRSGRSAPMSGCMCPRTDKKWDYRWLWHSLQQDGLHANGARAWKHAGRSSSEKRCGVICAEAQGWRTAFCRFAVAPSEVDGLQEFSWRCSSHRRGERRR